MQYSPDELKDYLLDELAPDRKAAIEALLRDSVEAREELAKQRLLLQALRELPEAEPERRIAFVAAPEQASPADRWRRAGVLAGAARAAAIAASVALAIAGGMWVLEPILTRDATGWTLSIGDPEPTVQTAATEDQLRALIREELSSTETRLKQALMDAAQTAAEGWTRSELASVRRELTEVRDDAVAGYQFVNAKHEMLKRQLVEFELAAVPDGQP